MTPACRTSKIGEIGNYLLVYRRVVVHWRAIILLLILAPATFLIAHADFFDLLVFALLLIFIASQFFWIGRILDLGERFIPGMLRHSWLVGTCSRPRPPLALPTARRWRRSDC